MANLSNINNKFLFTDGDFLKIGNLAPINNISGTESGISVTNGNCASITLDNSAASGKTFVIYSAVNGSLNFFDADAASGRLIIDSSGNSTFAGNVSTGNLTVTNTTSGWTAYINNNIGSGTQSGLLLDAGSSSADFAMYVRNAAGSSDFFAIKGNGNLGIGTSLPEGKLDVVDGNAIMTFKAGSSDRPYLQLRHDAVPVDGEELAIMDFSGYNDASQNTRYVILTAKAEDVTDGSEDGSLSLLTMKDGTATNTMSLRSGSVGIGTTSPGTKLQVGDGTADDTIRTVFSDGSYTDIHGYGLEMSRGFSYIRPTTSNTQTLYIGDQAAGNNWSVISNNASTHIWRDSSSERMRIDSSGNVGIGTTSPVGKLTIAGDMITTSSSTTELFSSKSVYGQINFEGVLGTGSGAAGTRQQGITWRVHNYVGATDYQNQAQLVVSNNGNVGTQMGFFTSGNYGAAPVERLRISYNGAIGIGGANYGTSGQVLTSNGNAAPSWQAAGGSSPWTTSGNDIYNNNSGNVGIGVTSPGAKLEIDGDVIYKNVNQYQTTIARTIEFTCYLQGSNTYTLIQFTQPSTNAQVMATIEFGGIITGNSSERFAGSNSSITKYNVNGWHKSFVELGYVGNTSYRPQFYWDFGRLMINVKNSTDNLFRIRLTYRGFGAAPTKTYPN